MLLTDKACSQSLEDMSIQISKDGDWGAKPAPLSNICMRV